ncbi:olfactomedin-like protein 2B [Gastrophryne carolinensis]
MKIPQDQEAAESYSHSRENTLEDESDNQENILSQLLGDYDKVKAISEGTDCKCKCVVKPLNRQSCERLNDQSLPDEYYTVETITSGQNCKCSCVAPPSALNPCEGDFRLKKLQEAEKKGFKLSAITEMLEGAFFGLDILKLHSVTTKIVGRVEKLEEVVSKSSTKKQKETMDNDDEILNTMGEKKNEFGKTETHRIYNSGETLASDGAFKNAQERFLRDEQAKVKGLELNAAPMKHHRRHPQKPVAKNVIRDITFYKATDIDYDRDLDDLQDDMFSGDNTMDMLVDDQLIKHPSTTKTTFLPSEKLTSVTARTRTELHDVSSIGANQQLPSSSEGLKTTLIPMQLAQQITTDQHITADNVKTDTSSATKTTMPTPAIMNLETTKQSTVLTEPTWTILDPVNLNTVSPIEKQPHTTTSKSLKTLITNQSTASIKEQDDTLQKVIGRCKETISTISKPTTQNTYGRNEGAWMKDPLAQDEKIYVTNYYYGNTLVEFRNLENFKQGRWSNSYKLPYSWIGTGHAVYNGSFYYNRAFTRNIIKYDLKQRYVAAWAMLHDVVYEETTPWRWRGHSDIDFAVDENGLWVIYPAIDDEGFQQDVIVLSKVNAADLTTQKETTWRTGLRKDFYGNSFVICGVLYAVDNYNKKTANISYAFDTHTNTQIVPRLPFENEYAYTTQIDYNPKDRLLYAWDNGHQVTYNVIFAY